jgi:dipeptidyl aminopeptidase/acylaminoacyl peptidase
MQRALFLTLLCLSVAAGQKVFYPAAREGGNYMHNYYLPPAPSSYPWWPEWSPDGKSIAISWAGCLWQVDVQTGAATQLTYDRRYHSSPAWSPDGRWIVFTADDENRRIQLVALDTRTGETQDLTTDEHLYTDPAFSPDGSHLAYVSTAPNGHFNVYVRAFRDGKWAGSPMAITQDHRYLRDRLYFGVTDMHLQPAWLRDGKELLILSNRGVPLGSGHLWRVPLAEDAMRAAKPILTEQSLYRTRAHVSPEGKRILYASSAGAADTFTHLYIVPVDGGAPYKLTFGEHDDFHPRWSPDGERIAYISNEGGLPKLVVQETYGGKKRVINPQPVKWETPFHPVRIEVQDERGRRLPARIQSVASDGKSYAPFDAYSRVGMYGQHFFHTSGSSTVWAPPGRMRITALRGFEYWPATQEVDVKAGMPTVTLVLRRFVNLAAEGWRNGSTHVHMNYGGNYRNTLENLIFMSRAEHQDVLNNLVANKDNRILDWMYFVPGGGSHPASRPDVVAIVGEEYRPPFYGHMFFLGLKEHLISPFTTGYEGTAIESLYPSNADMLRKARVQGAVTGYVHPYAEDDDPLEGDLGAGRGFPVDVALGLVDAYEWSNSSRGQLSVWHKVLNADVQVTPTGGEDSISNLHISKPVGSLRTYAYLGKELSAAAWLKALRAGWTFFTGGPLLGFEIQGKRPGESVRLPAEGGRVRMRARVWSIAPVNKVVVYRNGREWTRVDIDQAAWTSQASAKGPCALLDTEVEVRESGWYALYAEGPYSELLDVRFPQASTNAIRIYVGEQPIRDKEAGSYFVRWVEKLRRMAEEWPWWRTEQEKLHVFAQFEEARKFWLARAQN